MNATCGFTWSWNGFTFACSSRSSKTHRHEERSKLGNGNRMVTTYFTDDELAEATP